MHGAWFASVPDDYFRQFASRYRSRFGGEPYRLASLGYDSVLLVNRVAAKWQPGAPFPQAALRDSGGFAGVDGAFRFGGSGVALRALEVQQVGARSEEHTSELQSLMRISYAVFCLTKKKYKHPKQ